MVLENVVLKGVPINGKGNVSQSVRFPIQIAFRTCVLAHTNLEVEDVRAVTRLDEHGLVLVCVIQRPIFVRIYREVERRGATLERRIERGAVSVLGFLRDELAAAEAQLRLRAASRGENGRIVDGDTDGLLRYGPYRGRVEGIAQKVEVLVDGREIRQGA